MVGFAIVDANEQTFEFFRYSGGGFNPGPTRFRKRGFFNVGAHFLVKEKFGLHPSVLISQYLGSWWFG